MKFNFAKQETIPQVEKTQEQFDAEILAEAEKLGTNIEKLKTEIDTLGGPEEFQKIYSEEALSEGRWVSLGQKEIKSNESDSLLHKKSSKNWARLTAVTTALTVIAVALGVSENHDNNIPAIVSVGMGSFATVMSGISAFKDRIKSKISERKAKTMDLKMKMTDTPFEI